MAQAPWRMGVDAAQLNHLIVLITHGLMLLVNSDKDPPHSSRVNARHLIIYSIYSTVNFSKDVLHEVLCKLVNHVVPLDALDSWITGKFKTFSVICQT